MSLLNSTVTRLMPNCTAVASSAPPNEEAAVAGHRDDGAIGHRDLDAERGGEAGAERAGRSPR